MRLLSVILLLMAWCRSPALAQSAPLAPVTDPEKAVFLTTDVTNFWRAFDAWQAGQPGNPFADLYVRPASVGARLLLEKNALENPDSLLRRVRRRRADYERARAASLRMATAVPPCRAAYRALQQLYPAAVFPPVYFAIGGFEVGGNSLAAGVLIGAEMNDPAGIAPLVAHEAVHAQQEIPYRYRILLEQCLIEGSADFIGELISGHVVKDEPYRYARGRERELWQEFVRDLNLGENDSFANWLYGGERPPGRPADLGYYIGYQITKAYYERAPDKPQAIREVLHIADARQFLARSGYGTQFK